MNMINIDFKKLFEDIAELNTRNIFPEVLIEKNNGRSLYRGWVNIPINDEETMNLKGYNGDDTGTSAVYEIALYKAVELAKWWIEDDLSKEIEYPVIQRVISLDYRKEKDVSKWKEIKYYNVINLDSHTVFEDLEGVEPYKFKHTEKNNYVYYKYIFSRNRR